MFNLMPKDPAFYVDLDQLAAMVARSIDLLAKLFDSAPDPTQIVTQIENERHVAHLLTREVLWRVDDAFITPFDREDILQLDSDLYGVMESIANAAERIHLYGMHHVYPHLQGQCTILTRVGKLVNEVVTGLRRATLASVRPQLDEIGRLEEQARMERQRFLSELYRGNPDPIDAIKKKELHDLMMTAIRACDSVGRTVERVLVKNA
jgi:uncharacterized protein Yka (UPF0111/DUF47 family)